MARPSVRLLGLGGVILGCLIAILPGSAPGQTPAQGNKAVYQNSTTPAPSEVWIDASSFCPSSGCTSSDFCTILAGALATLPPSGAVVDARGLAPLSSPSGTSTCTSDPFSGISRPSTVLLPAYTISISMTWVLPNNTRLVGEGPATVLQAQSSLSTAMIQMGPTGGSGCPSSGCTSIGVEHLLLDASGAGTSLTSGIDNQAGQDGSYVSDVNFYQFSTTGLLVESGATNSGPYKNLSFSSGGSYGACVQIDTQTLGLQGITCTGITTPTSGEAAIIINASNNSVEYAHIESFWDGVAVGALTSGTVRNVVLSSVTGSADLTNVVHICGSATSTNYCSAHGATVEDVTVSQAGLIENFAAAGSIAATTIQDDVTGTSIEECASGDVPASTATYILGEQLGTAGNVYSRFASNPSYPTGSSCTGYYGPTSTKVPTWAVGITTLSGLPACLTPGAIYSNSNGGSMTSVYVCSYSGWKPIV